MTNERYLSMALLEVEKGNGIPAPGDPSILSQPAEQ